MTDIRGFKALSLLTTIGVLVVSACTIQLRGGGGSPPPLKAEETTDANSSDLARCRNVAAEEVGYQHCKRVWAENRRRFFSKKDGAAGPAHDDSDASVALVPKDQSRIPQGYPSAAGPEASKP